MERKDMMTLLKRAVIQALKEGFSLPVYGERVPQKTKVPCFSITVEETVQKRLLGRRRAMEAKLKVRYTGAEEKDKKETAAAAAAVADGLYEVLWLVGSAERFGARSMSHTMTEDGVDFFVTYGWQIIVEQQGTLMERLEYNGEKVIGYEENEV